MKMLLSVLVILGTVSTALGPETAPKLVNETVLFKAKEKVLVGWGYLLLGDGGKKVIFTRGQMTDVKTADGKGAERRWVISFWVLDVASGERKRLPLPSVVATGKLATSCWFQSQRPSSDMTLVLLPSGKDADRNGVYDARYEKRRFALYDSRAGKAYPVGVPAGRFIYSAVEQKGKSVLVYAMDPESRRVGLYSVPRGGAAAKARRTLGIPLSVCPSKDLAVLFVPRYLSTLEKGKIRLTDREGEPDVKPDARDRLLLCDLKADKAVTELPTDRKYFEGIYPPTAHWTSGGRYLYYGDVKFDRPEKDPLHRKELKRPVTRVWDCKLGREAAILDRVLPAGSGPTPTTMTLVRYANKQGALWRPDGMDLHDAATGSIWSLFSEPIQLFHCQGGRLLYCRGDDEMGKETVRLVTIQGPRKKGAQ